jgi:hypothetical protein
VLRIKDVSACKKKPFPAGSGELGEVGSVARAGPILEITTRGHCAFTHILLPGFHFECKDRKTMRVYAYTAKIPALLGSNSGAVVDGDIVVIIEIHAGGIVR